MIYLSGKALHNVTGPLVGSLGVILTPTGGQSLPVAMTWAADSGCFNRKTYVGDEAYLAWLAKRAGDAERCLFATVPDVVADHDATLAMFEPMASRVRALGYPVAFVGQDGASVETVPWDDFEALFIGGSTDWKLSETAHALVAEGKARGKWVHVGRVNSLRRLRVFASADSADGTFLAFGPDVNVPRLAYWLRDLRERPSLWSFPEAVDLSVGERHGGRGRILSEAEIREAEAERGGRL